MSQVLFAFMVGLHNLYWYYGSQTYYTKKNGVDKLAHTSEAFQGSDIYTVSHKSSYIDNFFICFLILKKNFNDVFCRQFVIKLLLKIPSY